MSDGISMDTSDLYSFFARMDNVPDELPKGVDGAMRGAAHTGKDAWQRGLESSSVPAAASTIWYRFVGNAGRLSAAIENSRGSRRLRGYVYAREYGSPTVTPGAHAAAAAEAAAADLAKGLRVAGENAINRAMGA